MPRDARFQWPKIQRAEGPQNQRQQSGAGQFQGRCQPLQVALEKRQRKRQELGQLREKCAPTSTAMRYRVPVSRPALMLLPQLEIGQSRP
jgi:hypothetical protein